MNSKITKELLRVADYYESIGDEGRMNAYRKAVNSIEEYNRPIISGDQAKQLKWIGDGIAAKIDSILGIDNDYEPSKTNSHRNTEEVSDTPSSHNFILEGKNGGSKSHKIDEKSIRPDLRNKVNINTLNKESKAQTQTQPQVHLQELNKSSRTLRIKQYEIANKPQQHASVVSRGELGHFVTCVKKTWEKLVKKYNNKHTCNAECCGTFRRGSSACHECVILLKSDIPFERLKSLFKDLIYVFTKLGLLNKKTQQTDDYYQGILDISRLFKSSRTQSAPSTPSYLPIVIRLVEQEAWPCALLKWTGPSVYWSRLQTTANKMGYELNEKGLYFKNKTTGIGKRLHHKDEFDVLSDLNLEYTDPIYR